MNENSLIPTTCTCLAFQIASQDSADITDAQIIRLAERSVELSAAATAHGNHPFGALLIYPPNSSSSSSSSSPPPLCSSCGDSHYRLLEAENTVHTLNDVTHHAELNLVSRAWKALDASQRLRCVLVTSTEPCAMCAGAIYWAGIKHVVYVCPAALLNRHAGESLACHSTQVFAGAKDAPSCLSLIERCAGAADQAQRLQDLAEQQHQSYWPNL